MISTSPTFLAITEITGIQWYWIFNSSDMTLLSSNSISDLVTISTNTVLAISAGANLVISLTAGDVIHAIALPNLGLKIDAIPGRLAISTLSINLAGIYGGQCSELCGAMHALMPLTVNAL